APNNQDFVNQVYEDLLGRPVDGGGAAYWTSYLNAGHSRAEVVRNLESGTEFLGDQVDGTFQWLLHRGADPGAQDYFVHLMQAGAPPEQIATLLAGSPRCSARTIMST